MNRQHILIDTDPGIDDALAILLAIASPEVHLHGLSIVHGNCSALQGTVNALSILELSKQTSLPVAKGCDIPLVQPSLLAPETHGNTGLGYAQLPAPVLSPASKHAVEFIIDTVLAHPHEINIVAIGPLTNLALAFRLKPEIIPLIKHLYIMGGAIRHEGNTTPLAEFNTYVDPHAAHIVYHAPVPKTLIPLDVTYQIIIQPPHIEKLLNTGSPIAQFIADATRFYMEFHDAYQKIEGCVINDPLALAACFSPEFLDTEALYVDVDISGGVSMGKTFADFYRMTENPPNMNVALNVKAAEFVDFFIRRMLSLCNKID